MPEQFKIMTGGNETGPKFEAAKAAIDKAINQFMQVQNAGHDQEISE